MCGNLLRAVFNVVVRGQNSNITVKSQCLVMHQDGGNYVIPKAVGCSFLTLWRLWLSPISVYVGFVMDNVFSLYLGFSLSLSF
jgi:hypothetical protein